jgi:hypothetical protein
MRAAHARPIRGRRAVGPLLLYFLISLVILFPYRTNALRPVGDLPIVMSLTLQANHALAEGQFPIRIGPECEDGMRFPVFQFYGSFPYTVTGALSIVLHNPYTAWKITCLLSLLGAGYFMMRLCLWLCGNERASVLAGAMFMCAPYLMTDLNARGAFAEMVAFCLMPAAFYATLRCLESTHWRRVLWCAIGWTVIGLTHNISYLYGVIFAGLFCVPFLLSRRAGPRLLRLAMAGLAHACLMLWYVMPQFRIVNLLQIHGKLFNPFDVSQLAPLRILLAPVRTNNIEGMSTPTLGLQVGWPILAGVVLALIGFVLPRRTPAPRRLMISLLLAGISIAFFMAWSPVNFWRFLPKMLWYVQFPYRLLLFVVLFGSGLFASGLARLFPRRVPLWAASIVLAGVGLAVASYIPHGRAQWADYVPSLYRHPEINGLTEYLTAPDVMARTNVSDADPANFDWPVRMAEIDTLPAKGPLPRVGVPMSQVRYGARTHIDYFAKYPLWLEMPVLDYPGLIEVRDNGHLVKYHNAGRFVTLRLARGMHRIAIAFVGVRWANIVSLVAWVGVIVLLLFPAIQSWGAHIGGAVTTLPSLAARASFPPRQALAGFLVLLVFAAVPSYPPLRTWLKGRPTLHVSASASSEGPENAFDDDLTTSWVAIGSGPATLNVELSRPAAIHGLALEPRMTSLNECWQHLVLTLFKDGRQVYNADFDFAGAAKDPQMMITFPSVPVDRIEMRFSNPVLTTYGGGHVKADQVNPGYREIQIMWGS